MLVQLWERFLSLAAQFTWRDALDMALISVLLYQLLAVTRETRANQVLKGLAFFLLAYLAVNWMQLQAISYFMSKAVDAGVIALVIMFQPELRRALEQIGRGRIMGKNIFRRDMQGSIETVEAIVRASLNLARTRTGALMVVTGQIGLTDVMPTGTIINGQISSGLLENIFVPNTPLHDGAVLIKGDILLAAGCVLPLTDQQMNKELGTRHRAALGLSEVSDALIVVVSEETGVISIAQNGRLTRHVHADTLTTELTHLYGLEQAEPSQRKGVWTRWTKKDRRDSQS